VVLAGHPALVGVAALAVLSFAVVAKRYERAQDLISRRQLASVPLVNPFAHHVRNLRPHSDQHAGVPVSRAKDANSRLTFGLRQVMFHGHGGLL